MSQRRIGFDAIRALRNTTGLGNYARGVLRGLRRHDARMDIHLYAPEKGREPFVGLPAELDATLHLPPARLGPLARATWRTFRIGRAAAGDGVQLFHGLSHEIPRDLPATGIRSVVSFHDLIYEKHPGYFPLVDRLSYRWRYRWSATHATAIVAVSAQTRDDLVELYHVDPSRIAVVPPACLPGFASPVGEDERAAVRKRYELPAEFLFSLGTLEPRKNHQVLIRALAALGPDEAPVLVLAGRDGGALRSLQRQVATHGLAGRVRVLTDVADADLPALMQSATIFLYPSLAEGFGMPIVEALSSGTPVIASALPCLQEAGGPGSRYVPADRPDEWAAAIRDLLGDATAAASMRQSGRTWARQFDAELLAGALVTVYDAVVAGEALPAGQRTADSFVGRTN